jgi:ribosomal protection tetracycline resistance protein
MKILKTLNLGILAHVDAGKTSLTERLLYNAGVTKTLGSVDSGDTQTDSLILERQRGITIQSAVVSFAVNDVKINLIDTPGHPDFIAEVERSLSVLDAVVLVISAVEGIQPQTRVLMRALRTMAIPTFILVNKVDRMGARDADLIEAVRTKLFPNIAVMNSVIGLGSRDAVIDSGSVKRELPTDHISTMQVVPVYFGSAITGVGVPELTQALTDYAAKRQTDNQQPDSTSGLIFKIERGKRNEKIVYVRLYAGELRLREQVGLTHLSETGQLIETLVKPIAMQLFEDGKTVNVTSAYAGDIVKVWGLSDAVINDYLGQQPDRLSKAVHFTRPNFEVVVEPRQASDRPKLYAALQQISEQDPFVEVRQSKRDGTIMVQLCGEVQKEVIEDTLRHIYGVGVSFSTTSIICIERPNGVGEGLKIGVQGDPYLGTVGLRIETAPVSSGAHYERASSVLGTMPDAFFTAVEESVIEALHEGVHGWSVTDCLVTLTHTGFWPRQSHSHASFDKSMSSTAGDFRTMAPLALIAALEQAGTTVYEPINHFELEIPAATLATVMQSLVDAEAKLDRLPEATQDVVQLQGFIPARRTFAFERKILDLAGGEGAFVTSPGGYQPTQGKTPSR